MKKNIVFLLFAIFGCALTYAQRWNVLKVDPNKLKMDFEDSNSSILTTEAVARTYFLSKQAFRISDKENGNLYGLKGHEEFGTQFSIGIKFSNGYILTNKAIQPWQYDSRFTKYKEKYIPVPYTSTYTELGKKVNYVDISIANPVALCDSSLFMFNSGAFGRKGLEIDTTKGQKDGWLVWMTADRNLNFEQTSDVGFLVEKKAITVDKPKQVIDIDAPKYQTDSIIGAIYVVPVYPEIGTIVFKLCGIAIENEGKWQLACPFVGMTFDEPKSEKPQDDDSGNVNGGNSDEDELSELTPIEKPAKSKGKKKKK